VPAVFSTSDPDTVPPSADEGAASVAYRARKRRHADIERGCPSQPGFQSLGPRPSHRQVQLLGHRPFRLWGRPRAGRVPGTPERTRRRQVLGTPGVPPPPSTAQPRRPSRVALSEPSGRRPARAVPARLAKVAKALRGATTIPVRQETGLVADRRPSRAAALLPPVTTERITGGAGTAATKMRGTAAYGQRPVRAMIAAIPPPAVTVPRGLPTEAKATGETPATTDIGAWHTAVAAGATRSLVPVRGPVRTPRVGMSGTTTIVPRRRRSSLVSRVPL